MKLTDKHKRTIIKLVDKVKAMESELETYKQRILILQSELADKDAEARKQLFLVATK